MPPSPGADIPGLQNHWAAPASSPAPPPPAPPPTPPSPAGPRARRGLILTVVLVSVLTLVGVATGLGVLTARMLRSDSLVGRDDWSWQSPPPDTLRTSLLSTGMHCTVELESPQLNGCYALAPEDWAEIRWMAGPDEVEGVTFTVDHHVADTAMTGRLAAALTIGLGLSDDVRAQLVEAVELLAADEDAEPVDVDTPWGYFSLSPSGDGRVEGYGESYLGEMPPVQGPALGVAADEAVALVEEHGYRCRTDGEDGSYVQITCEIDGRWLGLSGIDDELSSIEASPYSADREVVVDLLALTAGTDRVVLQRLLDRTTAGGGSAVDSDQGWVVLSSEDWVWVGPAAW